MDDVATIIKEYAMPLTRGDWRRLHKYTNDRFQEDLAVLNYNLYLQIHRNKRNGGYLLQNKFKYLFHNKKLLFFNGVYYSIEELHDLVVVIQRGNRKLYCLYKTDTLEIDGYIYQGVDQIIYILAVYNVRRYIEKILLTLFIVTIYTILV